MIGYRNKNTGDVYTYDEPSADLDARPNFERVDVSGDVSDLHRRAAAKAGAERTAIEQAAHNRAQLVRTTDGTPSGSSSGGAAVPNAAHYTPAGFNDSTGVLSKPELRNTFTTQDELRLVDERERERAGEQAGVLARGHDESVPTASPVEVAAHEQAKADAVNSGGSIADLESGTDGEAGTEDGGGDAPTEAPVADAPKTAKKTRASK